MSAVSTPRLRIEVQQSAERVLVFPEGDVDLSSYDEFRAALAEAVTAGRAHVVVDLARVSFIDSMGLGALVSGLHDANEAGSEVSLICSSPHLSRLLQVTGLSQLFHVYQHRAEVMGDWGDA